MNKSFFLLFALLLALSIRAQIACADDPIDQARQYRLSGEYAKAEKIYNEILKINPHNTDALVARGFSRLMIPDAKTEALDDFNRAITISPDYVDAYIGKAVIYKQQRLWKKVERTLEDALKAVTGQEDQMHYLAVSAWQQRMVESARRIEKQTGPVQAKEVYDNTNSVHLGYSYDWVVDRPNWFETNFTFVSRLRPGLTWSLYHHDYNRDSARDYLVGTGFVYQANNITDIAYDVYFSGHGGFVPDQKHRPKVNIDLPFRQVLGVGADFDEVSDKWNTIGRFEYTKYLRNFFLKYTLLNGDDVNDNSAITHIGEIGWEKENVLQLKAGYATGNESIEKTDTSIDGGIDINTAFAGGRFFVAPEWGINLNYAYEIRNSQHFRSTGSWSVFYLF